MGARRHFLVVSIGPARPAAARPSAFGPAGAAPRPRPRSVAARAIQLDDAAPLAGEPIAIEAARDGTVLVLDRNATAPHSLLRRYRNGAEAGEPVALAGLGADVSRLRHGARLGGPRRGARAARAALRGRRDRQPGLRVQAGGAGRQAHRDGARGVLPAAVVRRQGAGLRRPAGVLRLRRAVRPAGRPGAAALRAGGDPRHAAVRRRRARLRVAPADARRLRAAAGRGRGRRAARPTTRGTWRRRSGGRSRRRSGARRAASCRSRPIRATSGGRGSCCSSAPADATSSCACG